MSQEHHAIILKSFFPHKHTLSLLTKEQGKIKLVILNSKKIQRLGPGASISFHANNHITIDAQIINTPYFKNLEDMYWLHHLLELCYYFIPLGEECLDQFIVLQSALALVAETKNVVNKKLITGLLLTTLGFYPPSSLAFLFELKKILSSCIDFIPHKKIEFLTRHLKQLDNKQMGELDEWILACITSHPRYEMFKTIIFIYKPA